VDDLTGSFSLGSTVLIGDLDAGQQAKIRFPDDRDSLLTHAALTGSGRIAAAAIPFLNARVQGLDVFFRSGIRPFMDGNATEQEKQVQKAMLIRGMTILGLSVMYAAAISGNPDYEKQEEETKDNNWIIPMGEGKNPLKIPIPFEVGTLFKTIPERIYHLTTGHDTPKDFQHSMTRAITSTFGINPVPQAAMPVV
jgi:hypothetical protein